MWVDGGRRGQTKAGIGRDSERRRAQTLPDVTHAAGSANAGGATNFETAEMASHAGLCDFLLSALEFDPQERLTASAALGHPWLSRLA